MAGKLFKWEFWISPISTKSLQYTIKTMRTYYAYYLHILNFWSNYPSLLLVSGVEPVCCISFVISEKNCSFRINIHIFNKIQISLVINMNWCCLHFWYKSPCRWCYYAAFLAISEAGLSHELFLSNGLFILRIFIKFHIQLILSIFERISWILFILLLYEYY